jgi:hypothetical protein
MQATKKKPATAIDVMRRYPHLTAHLVSESLGYFTPGAAASAIKNHILHRPYFCEWYVEMARGYNDDKVGQIGTDTLNRTFKNRHHHQGYMAEYDYAKKLVEEVLDGGEGPTFASWF